MSKLSKAINKIIKFAMEKSEFENMIYGSEQFAIISTFTGNERMQDDVDVFRRSPIERLRKVPKTEPDENLRKSRPLIPDKRDVHKNLRDHLVLVDSIRRTYPRIEEIESSWNDAQMSPGGDKISKDVAERSLLIRNISFQNAYDLSKKYKQEMFIYKPHNGPVQLIPLNWSKEIVISKKWAHSTGDSLYSKFLNDGSSFSFDFGPNDSLSLPNKGSPYIWTDRDLQYVFSKKEQRGYSFSEEPEKTKGPQGLDETEDLEDLKNSEDLEDLKNPEIEEPIKEFSYDDLTEGDKYIFDKHLKHQDHDKKVSDILKKPPVWRGKYY